MGLRKSKAGKSAQTPNLYSDALYQQAAARHQSSYGYSPIHNHAAPSDPAPAGKPHISGGAMLAVCLVCILVASVLGIGGTFFAFRHQAAISSQKAEAALALYEVLTAEAVSYESSEAASFLSLSSAQGLEPLSAEDIYAAACQSTVGITIPGYSSNIFGQRGANTVSGSGLILGEDGYILTNYHVIESAYTQGVPILVITFDGAEYIAEVIGVESDSDLAVLKIDAAGLVPAVLGDSRELRVGQTIYAIGNPLGELTYTMTSGIVSALNRSITTDINATVNMFQIDAAVNNGNSGGPVYNAYGQVIGIVTAKYSESGMEGLGFAIPVNNVFSIANELITNGYISGKAYLGLTLTTVSSSVARYYNLVQGVYVYSVEPESCAQEAGLKTGDIITAIDGQPLLDKADLIAAVKNYRAGDRAELTVYRDQAYTLLTVIFDEALPAESKTPEELVLDEALPAAQEPAPQASAEGGAD